MAEENMGRDPTSLITGFSRAWCGDSLSRCSTTACIWRRWRGTMTREPMAIRPASSGGTA